MKAINRNKITAGHLTVFNQQSKEDDNSQVSDSMIKHARKSGHLHLASRGLASVPEKVWSIDDAPSQDAADVRFDKPDQHLNFWDRKNLTSLDLSSNVLNSLSDQIHRLADLTELDLHDNALTSLPKEIGLLTQLTRLNLNRNNLITLPVEFFELTLLRQLNLAHNKLDEISVKLSNLVMLETLDISHNSLTHLPSGIGFLVRLTDLTLGHNKLRELPNDIVNLRLLHKLDLMNNELQCLPPIMGELRRLECFYVQHNDVRVLPDFTGCENLKELHISNNFIDSIPVDFCETLPHLKILDLRDNKIEKLPDEIAALQSLIRLDLSNNTINSIPNSLASLAHLVSLQLEGNPIRSIRRDIIQCGTVRILKTLKDRAAQSEIDERESKKIVKPFCIGERATYPDKYQMRKSRAIVLAMKNLSTVPISVFTEGRDAEVNSVDLSKNQFAEVPVGLSELASQLTELDVSHNLLTAFPEFISQFDRVHYVNLACNRLAQLPSEFGLLNTLRELNIANNKFTEIPLCVFELVSLEILLARDNQIEKIDASGDGLGKLKRLAVLDLANNNIDHVPPVLGKMKHINSLELNGNRFRQPRHQILQMGTDAIMSYLRDRIPV